MNETRKWMIYGANGYTGGLTAREAKVRGLKPILAGRNRSAVQMLGHELGFETRVFGLDNETVIGESLKDIAVVLHCAGPFSATSQPMLAGCMRAGTHYLDITGEIDVFEYIHQRDALWKKAGIIAMPGVGFDVVPSDCLAAMLKRDLADATDLRLAFKSHHGRLSPGTTKTMIEGLPKGCRVRREGRIVKTAFKTAMIPFTGNPDPAGLLSWGDVSTAYYSTGIPNIEVYIGGSQELIKRMNPPGVMRWFMGLSFMQSVMKSQAQKRVKGPSDSEREADEMLLWGQATNATRTKVAMRMRTPEGYSFTVDSSLAAVARVLAGGIAPGALTPSKAFGPNFVFDLSGVRCERIA